MVSIIILSYNTRDLTLRCLTSIQAQLKGFSYEVIVLDNDSADDSVQAISREFPRVKLIKNKKNVGFAAGCNQAAKEAKGEYLLFLNSDVELPENIPAKLLRVFERHKNAGIVGGMLQNVDGTLQRSYGSYYSLPFVFRMLFGGDRAEMKRFLDNGIKRVDWVSGGLLLIKREVYEKLQGFDEHFFMYVEDMELCFRAHQAGYGIYIDPSSVATHVGQGSSDKSFAIMHIFKGLLYFYKKHKNKLQYTILTVLLRLKAGLCILLGSVTGNRRLVTTYQKALQVL